MMFIPINLSKESHARGRIEVSRVAAWGEGATRAPLQAVLENLLDYSLHLAAAVFFYFHTGIVCCPARCPSSVRLTNFSRAAQTHQNASAHFDPSSMNGINSSSSS